MSLDLMTDLLEWCRKRREQDKFRLDMMEWGNLRFHQDSRDVTESEISRLKIQIAELDALMARMRPEQPRLR